MMDGIDYQIKQHRIFLKQRATDRIIQSPLFQSVWDESSEWKKNQAKYYICWLEVRQLQLWLYSDFENYTVRELRHIASNNHVLNYCLMSKSELIQHFLEKGITDERNRETINRDETVSIGSKCAEASDSCSFWGTQGKNIRWSL